MIEFKVGQQVSGLGYVGRVRHFETFLPRRKCEIVNHQPEHDEWRLGVEIEQVLNPLSPFKPGNTIYFFRHEFSGLTITEAV